VQIRLYESARVLDHKLVPIKPTELTSIYVIDLCRAPKDKDFKYEFERRKHPAEEILDVGSLDVDKAMEGEDELA